MSKTVLITGGSRGIGRATVEKFAAEGWNVITTSTSGKLPYELDNVTVYQMDLTDSDSIEALAKELKGTKIDVLVNNAAIGEVRGTVAVEMDTLKKVLNTNLIGTINLTEQLLPSINEPGVIINISSEFGSLTEDWGDVVPSYKISKAAINMYTHTLAPRLEKRSIKVASFDPGWVKTDMGSDAAPDEPEKPAAEIFELANSDFDSGYFYRGLEKRDW